MFDLKETLFPLEVTEQHVDTILLLFDAVIHETTAENILPYLDENFPRDRLDEYLKEYSRPSKLPGMREFTKEQMCAPYTSTQQQRDFRFLAHALESRYLTPLFTNSFKLLSEMTMEEKEALLRSWRDSSQALKKNYIMQPLDILEETLEKLYDGQPKPEFRYKMMKKPEAEGEVLLLPEVDVLIIGSGSGAGVVAHTLSERGQKCLVLERGKYYHESEMGFDEKEARDLLQNYGVMATADLSLYVLAGNTFGGASTVNWSACFKTPFKVRKEWYDDYGIDWVATESYEECADYVWNKMGVSADHVEHSFSNKLLMDGGEKLGYQVASIPQNTAGQPHNCGYCNLGCKHGVKQGTQAFWLRDAAKNGCQFMDQVKVIRIIHEGGEAKEVLCENRITGTTFTIRGPKTFVVSGGSFNTPVLLQNSGFKNKNIGQNLQLHPSTNMYGFFEGVKTDPHNYSIMTSVCTEKSDLDGKYHGAKIELNINAPNMHMAFHSWDGSENARNFQMRYQGLSAMMMQTRDTTVGSVRCDPDRPEAVIIDYAINKFDRDALLLTMSIAADVLYIEGAAEILAPQSSKLHFKSSKPKEERSVDDKDFVEFKNRVANWPIEIYSTKLGSAHQMSSCRMSGKGPAYGACDTKGKLFESKNVYVADASSMPTACGVNPMISTMTIARHIALDIAKQLEDKAKL
ncbi:putative fatty alcohol oxidase [Suhomyces tanzawaensis NRRL Y-17324]|uniref:Long-chain-alcohol oxidase n=1 Tax=Suhomyces tanzawaensis NRRL Y-17324 TaxID=984487 RepID=A0A1E4SFN0_9ASCO|nr:putative fatty alcohol oxidase [Suhomyces tanzawaensis NRRL Y-17324]ODV78329.1 putative fatty alcohol oxidase [Suhomyces tanzawaensis NRRL Y-17324]